MDKEKEKEAMRRLEEMKKKKPSAESDQKENTSQESIPREAFRKNIGCGG